MGCFDMAKFEDINKTFSVSFGESLNVSNLSSEQIQIIVDATLERAKESGYFNGEDGKTPQKGVDYFTEADKADMVSDVLNALPTWQGGAF